MDWALDLGSLRSWYCPHNPVSLDCAGAVPLLSFVHLCGPAVGVGKWLSQLESERVGQLLPFNARCFESCSRICLKPLAWTQLEGDPPRMAWATGHTEAGVLFPFCCGFIGYLLAPV